MNHKNVLIIVLIICCTVLCLLLWNYNRGLKNQTTHVNNPETTNTPNLVTQTSITMHNVVTPVSNDVVNTTTDATCVCNATYGERVMTQTFKITVQSDFEMPNDTLDGWCNAPCGQYARKYFGIN